MKLHFIRSNKRTRCRLDTIDVFVQVAGEVIAHPDAMKPIGFTKAPRILNAVGERFEDQWKVLVNLFNAIGEFIELFCK